MKKVILSLLLVLIFASLFAASVYADETTDYTDLKFAKAFAIVSDEETDVDSALTRIQLAEMFYRTIFGDLNYAAGAADVSFNDVPDEKKHIAGAMSDLGIMNGYSTAIFGSDDGVTYNQLMKAFVSFLGYDAAAQSKGGFPSGYLAQANRLRLSLGTQENAGSYVSLAAALKLFKQALNIDMAVFQDEKLTILKDENYLKHYRGIDITEGIITGNFLTNLLSGELCSFGKVYLDGKIMTVDSSASGIEDELCNKVIVYYERINSQDIIRYYEKRSDDSLEIDADDLIAADNSTVKYLDDGKARKALLSSAAQVVYNGSYLASYSSADLMPFSEKNGNLRLIDKNGDGSYDFIVVSAYDSYLVKNVFDNIIYCDRGNAPATQVDLTDYKERNIDIKNILGEPITIDDIKKDQIVNVFADKSGKVKKIIVTRDAITAVIESIEKGETSLKKITLNGVEFDVSSSYWIKDSRSMLKTGKTAKVYFNCDAKIAYIDVDGTLNDGVSVGLLLAAVKRKGLDDGVDIRLMTQEGEFISPEVPEKLKINEISQKGNTIPDVAERNNDGKLVVQPVMYSLSDDGTKLKSIKFPKGLLPVGFPDREQKENGFYEIDRTKFDSFLAQSEYYGYTKKAEGLNQFGVALSIADKPVMFSSKSDVYSRDKDYTVTTQIDKSVELAEGYRLWGTKDHGLTVDIILKSKVSSLSSAASPAEDNERCPIFIVTKVINTTDEDGDDAVKIEGSYMEGTTPNKGYFLMNEDDLREQYQAWGGTYPKAGDILRTESFGEYKTVNKIQLLYSRANNKFCGDGGTYSKNPTAATLAIVAHRYAYGKVLLLDGGTAQFEIDCNNDIEEEVTPQENVKEVQNVGKFKGIFECTTESRGKRYEVKESTPECMRDVKNFGEDGASDVFVYNRGSAGICIFVFND